MGKIDFKKLYYYLVTLNSSKKRLFIILCILSLIFNIYLFYGNRLTSSYSAVETEDLIRNGEYEKAEIILKEMYLKKPDDFLINKYIGRVYFITDKYDSALFHFNKSLKIKADKEISDWINLIGIVEYNG